MVGVPGRSQGCHTCRRRRVKCNSEKPSCERCRVARLQCEGYDRGFVFLNRNARGLMKRQPFEEVLRRPHPTAAPQFTEQPALGRQIDEARILTTRLEGLFLEKFLVSSASTEWPSPGIYVHEVIRNLPRDWVLQPAIQALCLSKTGRINNDTRLIQQGKSAYVLALKRLHVNISRPDRVASDSTFAATKVLNLYEIYEPSDATADGLFNHASGLLSLLQARHQDGYISKAARLILQASRYNLMISCIQKSQYSDSQVVRVGQRELPFTTMTDAEQALYDLGFEVGNFIHQVRQVRMAQSFNPDEAEAIAKKHISIQECLWTWFYSLANWYAHPLWIEDQTDGSFSFPQIAIAHALMDYWTINIVLNTILERLSVNEQRNLSESLPQREDSYLPRLYHLASEADATARTYARNIAKSMNYCCQPEMGFVGPQRTMFANCVSISFWRTRPDANDQVEEVIETMKRLRAQSGLTFGCDMIDPTLPEWARL